MRREGRVVAGARHRAEDYHRVADAPPRHARVPTATPVHAARQ
jgi:hypothetical protein